MLKKESNVEKENERYCEVCNSTKNIETKIICRDINSLNYEVSWCKLCGNDEDFKKEVADAMYWKAISDSEKVPDLKYWELDYDREIDSFFLRVPDIDDINIVKNMDWKLKGHYYAVFIREEFSKVLGNEKKFRAFITKELRGIAKMFREKRKNFNQRKCVNCDVNLITWFHKGDSKNVELKCEKCKQIYSLKI